MRLPGQIPALQMRRFAPLAHEALVNPDHNSMCGVARSVSHPIDSERA